MPFDQAVRVVAQEVAVLEGARLAFVGVADEVLRAGNWRGMKLHLSRSGSRAAAAAQRDFLTSATICSGGIFSLRIFLQRRVASARFVILEAPVRAVRSPS
jgi:hypothetical protein